MVSEADKKLFQDAVGQINKKITTDKVVFENKQNANFKKQFHSNTLNVDLDKSNISNYNLSAAEEYLFYAKLGVQPKVLNNMKSAKIGYAPTLDLHGQTVSEAFISIKNFINYHKNKRFIHIVHGKGISSKNFKSVLKYQTANFLKDNPQVLAYCSCPYNYGGNGALFVLLKAKANK